ADRRVLARVPRPPRAPRRAARRARRLTLGEPRPAFRAASRLLFFCRSLPMEIPRALTERRDGLTNRLRIWKHGGDAPVFPDPEASGLLPSLFRQRTGCFVPSRHRA